MSNTPSSTPSHDHGHSTEDRIKAYENHGTTRRGFLRYGMGALGLVALGDTAAGNPLVSTILRQAESHDEHHSGQEEHAEHSEHPVEPWIDYAGTALFASGVGRLLKGQAINTRHYGALGLLTAIKYQASNANGKKHLREETMSNARAFVVIAGSIVAADGINAKVEEAYKKLQGKEMTQAQRVAAMCTLSSMVSPLATTVTGSTIFKHMSNDLCTVDGVPDPKLMALCESHISNLSGFVFFGDPPFIAMVEKYGFVEGIKFQMKIGLPMLIYSTFTTMYRINLQLAQRSGMPAAEAKAKALHDSHEGFVSTVPFLAQFLMRSVANAARYFTLQKDQDIAGLQFWIGETMEHIAGNIAQLPFSDKFDPVEEDSTNGMVHGEEYIRRRTVKDAMRLLLDRMRSGADLSAGTLMEGIDVPGDDSVAINVQALHAAIEAGDPEAIRAEARTLGIDGSQLEHIINTLQDLAGVPEDRPEAPGATKQQTQATIARLMPMAMWNRTFEVDRIKAAAGHNLGDVINVFPFQAGCVPFLVRAFKDCKDMMEVAIRKTTPMAMQEITLEAAMFALIERFSSVADNYVACKVGLEIMPEKGQVPLIASIIGGKLTAVGNMANVAQFSLGTFSLGDSLRQWRTHVPDELVGMAWTLLIGRMQSVGLMQAPPVAAAGH